MKSLEHISLVTLAIATALTISGCGHRDRGSRARSGETDEAAHAHDAEIGVSFNARKGLLVSQGTAKFIGLKVAEVEERKVSSTLQFSARVYRAASETQYVSTWPSAATTALASALVGASEAALLREGLPVTVAANATETLRGQVVGLDRDPGKTSGQVELLLAIHDAEGQLARGAFVYATVPVGGEKKVMSVPRSSLFRTTEGNFVYTVSGERFVRTAVRLGFVNHDFAEVVDGLYAGDQVVVAPVMTLWLAELQSLRGGKACADGQ